MSYQRRPMACCILAGEMEGGGLDMVMPVRGLMMGMALRPLAAGWWSLKLDWLLWSVGGMKEGEAELSEKPGVIDCGCWMGEDSGELLASEERSDEEMETSWRDLSEKAGDDAPEEWSLLTSLSVRRPGQNSMSSSRSNERTASNLVRKAERAADSLISFMPRTPRNWRCEF